MTDSLESSEVAGDRSCQQDGLLESRALEVTLFEDRAQVVREIHAAVAAGISRLRISGVTPFVDDRSLAAVAVSPASGVRVLSTKVVRGVQRVPPETVAAREKVIREHLLAYHEHVRKKDLARSRVRRFGNAVGQLVGGLGAIPPSDQVASWLSAVKNASDAMDAALEAKVASQWDSEKEIREARRLQGDLDALRLANPRYHAVVEVQVEADAPAEDAVFRLDYRTPCALWRPEYDAILSDEDLSRGKATLTLVRRAAVWQMTGEDWKAVKLSFSTARPARSATPPHVEMDRLELRKKTPEEARTVVVEAREQKIGSVGTSGGRSSELPGVDDGGEARLFLAAAPATIASDGHVAHVNLETATMEAGVALVAFPEIAGAVHLKASARLEGSMPILAGPVSICRGGGFVGRSSVGFVAPGDDLTLGFGTEDSIRIRRSVTEQKRDATLTSKASTLRKVALHISNMSEEDRSFSLEERIPVSEIEGVKVTLESKEGFTAPDADGKIHASVNVPGNGGLSLEFAYSVTTAGNVKLSF